MLLAAGAIYDINAQNAELSESITKTTNQPYLCGGNRMNSKKRYLSLSMVLVLVCSAEGYVKEARANSALDPYSAIKAPASKKAADPQTIPSVDDITTPKTYVSMPMAEQDDDKKGLVGSMLGTITAPTKTIKKASSGMVSGTKAAGANIVKGGKFIGAGMASGAGVIGSGIKSSGGKLVDGTQAVGSKIANVVPGHSDSPNRETATNNVSDIYINKAKDELAKVDDKEVSKQLAASTQDSKDKRSMTRRAFLSLDKRSKPKHVAPPSSGSGFYEGALASEASEKHADAVKAEEKQTEQVKTLATKPLDQTPSEKQAGSKWMPKLKAPTIGLGMFKKKEHFDKQLLDGAPATEVAEKSDDLKPQNLQETPSANQIISTKDQLAESPKAPSKEEEEKGPDKTFVANASPEAKAEKKGRFGKMPSLSMPKLKLNPFSRSSKQAPEPGASGEQEKDLQL